MDKRNFPQELADGVDFLLSRLTRWRFCKSAFFAAATNPAPYLATNGPVDIRDIKGPVAIPSGWQWLWWIAAAAAMIALALWAWRYWRRRPVGQQGPQIVIPPHVRARGKLREALAWIGQPRLFCILLSDAIRVYLEERFQFHAPDRTTEEFLDELQTSPLLALKQKQRLGDFLMGCDLVKFARYEPGQLELRELYESALRLVEETEPAPAPPDPHEATHWPSGGGDTPLARSGHYASGTAGAAPCPSE